MYYRILRSGLDGISGGADCYASIDEVLREVGYDKDGTVASMKCMEIYTWARSARAGDIFMVGGMVIIAVLSPNRMDDCCPECGVPYLPVTTKPTVEPDDDWMLCDAKCRGCGKVGHVFYRIWESSCGGHEDLWFECRECGGSWWIDGIDY